jgi:hypothetical protein
MERRICIDYSRSVIINKGTNREREIYSATYVTRSFQLVRRLENIWQPASEDAEVVVKKTI